jgi:hypothetical protein
MPTNSDIDKILLRLRFRRPSSSSSASSYSTSSNTSSLITTSSLEDDLLSIVKRECGRKRQLPLESADSLEPLDLTSTRSKKRQLHSLCGAKNCGHQSGTVYTDVLFKPELLKTVRGGEGEKSDIFAEEEIELVFAPIHISLNLLSRQFFFSFLQSPIGVLSRRRHQQGPQVGSSSQAAAASSTFSFLFCPSPSVSVVVDGGGGGEGEVERRFNGGGGGGGGGSETKGAQRKNVGSGASSSAGTKPSSAMLFYEAFCEGRVRGA